MKRNFQAFHDAHSPQLEDGSHILSRTTFKLEMPFPDKFPITELERVLTEQLGPRRKILELAVMVKYKTVLQGEGF